MTWQMKWTKFGMILRWWTCAIMVDVLLSKWQQTGNVLYTNFYSHAWTFRFSKVSESFIIKNTIVFFLITAKLLFISVSCIGISINLFMEKIVFSHFVSGQSWNKVVEQTKSVNIMLVIPILFTCHREHRVLTVSWDNLCHYILHSDSFFPWIYMCIWRM